MTKTVTTRCPRCSGLKYLYKVGSGFTTTDMGGAKVTCICCNGDGTISFDVPDLTPLVPEIKPDDIKEEKNGSKKKSSAGK